MHKETKTQVLSVPAKTWVKPELTVARVSDAQLGLLVGADLIILGTAS